MQNSLSTLFLICGLPGAGKTKLAKKLEVEKRAIRFTPDEWMARLGIDGHDEAKRAAIEQTMWELAARLLPLGVSIILDFGFWSRLERETYQKRAAELSARTEIRFLNASEEELLARLKYRRADAIHVTPAQIKEWFSKFEPPSIEDCI